MMQLSALYRYPLKSAAAQTLDEAWISPSGMEGDRAWMVIEPDGRMITGRNDPRMVLVRATLVDGGIRLEVAGQCSIEVRAAEMREACVTEVWRDRFEAWAGHAAADAWLSDFLGRPVRLLHVGASPARRRAYAPELPLSFVDAYPLLLIGEASLAELNARLATPVVMGRFRPNLVIVGSEPFAEDGWKRIRIGELEFEISKPCERCAFTTVDPLTGERSPLQEPLRTLARYRKTEAGVLFGQNVRPVGQGLLRPGMAVTLLES